MVVEISVPGCSMAQPASARTTPCRKKLSWSSAASIVHAFTAVLLIYPCGSELRASVSKGVCVLAQALYNSR